MQKATRQQTKEHNTRLVLKTIYHQAEISRAEIARITGLTRTTVSDIVSELSDEGLLEETGLGTSAGGKPPILLSLVDDARQLICIDLSNDIFQGAVVNLRGKITQRISLPSVCPEGAPALNCVYELIDTLVGAATAPLLGIGIGTPGLIDTRYGVVRRAVNLGWTDLPLKDLLETRYGLPIYLANDSHIAALAEYTFGEMRHTTNLVVIKVGQGIGSGIVLSGQIHYGDGFSAGEIGHLTVVENGSQCTCGNFGCLETVSSPRAIVRKSRQIADQNPDSILAKSVSSPEKINLACVLEAFEAGDQAVREIVHTAGRYLGMSIADLIGILNIHHIIISGNFSDFGASFLEAVRTGIKNRVLASLTVETKVVYSTLRADIGILGASALVLSQKYQLP